MMAVLEAHWSPKVFYFVIMYLCVYGFSVCNLFICVCVYACMYVYVCIRVATWLVLLILRRGWCC